jgi:hypothetical protein
MFYHQAYKVWIKKITMPIRKSLLAPILNVSILGDLSDPRKACPGRPHRRGHPLRRGAPGAGHRRPASCGSCGPALECRRQCKGPPWPPKAVVVADMWAAVHPCQNKHENYQFKPKGSLFFYSLSVDDNCQDVHFEGEKNIKCQHQQCNATPLVVIKCVFNPLH